MTSLKVLSVVGTTLVAALTASCTLPVEEQEPIGQATEAFHYPTTWTKGEDEVDLGSTTNRYCFLGEVNGDFDGGAEFVEVVKSDGRWKLRGGSGTSHTIGAGAYCRNRAKTVTGEATWTKGSPTLNLNTALNVDSGDSCFLTRVKGAFNGGGERVRVQLNGSTWELGGASGASGTLSASVRCVRDEPMRTVQDDDWHQNDSLDYGVMVSEVWSEPTYGCFLMGMQGQFQGGGESVGTWWDALDHHLVAIGGSSGQFGVAAWGGCTQN